MKNFTDPRIVRQMAKNNTGRFRGGKLVPIMFHKVSESESGVLTQDVTMELDPIPGRLISSVFGEMYSVFVPVQAMDVLLDPAGAYAGITEVIREKLLSNTPLFDLENEGPISKKAKVNPISVGGFKKVNAAVRLAYICAVNMLRQRAYFRATLVAHTNTAILPAIYAQTVLDKINGVLDPDDRVNGMVTLSLPQMTLPVSSRYQSSESSTLTHQTATGAPAGSGSYRMPASRTAPTDAGGKFTFDDITALFDGAETSLSMVDFYNADRMDDFSRVMDQMMRDNPQYGAEMVLRWAHGLSVDAGKTPWVLAERRFSFNKSLASAMDSAGVNNDVLRTDGMAKISISVPIPKTELGGMIVTMIALKPDEKLASQPEPFLTEPWTHTNYVADEMSVDPVAVLVRDLYSDCASGDESNVVAYTGLNSLKRTYIDYGFARDVDPASVEAKTAIWQIDVPLSVNPDNVNFPDYVDHGVFAFGGTEVDPVDVATFSIDSIQSSPTPMIVGPTPVEDIGPQLDPIFAEVPA